MKFFRTFVGSFYSVPMYQRLRLERGHGLGYTCLLVLLTIALAFFIYLPDMNRVHNALFVGENGRLSVMDDVLRQIAAQTPTMTFQNFKLHTHEPGVHVIRLSVDVMGQHAEGDAITIDTSGKTTYSNMKTPILVTENEMIIQGDKDTRVKPYKELAEADKHPEKAYVIDRQEAQEVAKEFGSFVHENIGMFYLIFGGIMLLFVVGFFYAARIIMILCIAAAGLLLANILRVKITFESAMRLASVSFTPVAVLSIVVPRFTNGSPNSFILLICGIIMFTAAFLATRDPKPDA